jgi:proteasome lid subunit RPN8/RPN11
LVLSLTRELADAMVATCVRALPEEGCGLLLGTAEGRVVEVVASENVAHSARVYEIDPTVLLRSYRRADAEDLEVIGVFHSHTHSPAYPSPTDIAQAPDPNWHYVLVSFETSDTVIKSYSILDGTVTEEVISL